MSLKMPEQVDPHAKLSEKTWQRYDRFNRAIAEVFFSGAYANRAVYLDLEVETLDRVAQLACGERPANSRAALIDAVVPTLQLTDSLKLFGRHRHRRLSWKFGARTDPPPHLATLALLSLVAESMRKDGAFTASAYYARLIEMITDAPATSALRDQVVKAHHDDVTKMWEELNGWLERDSTRGLPTAYAFDHRTYIGPALTQALVREADRKAFPDLFASSRLVPGQALEQADMVRLLEAWMKGSAFSSGLRNMCKSRATLEQVADVALAELKAWDGVSERSAAALSKGLRFMGRLRSHPRPSLELSLAARLPAGEAEVRIAGRTHEVELSDAGSGESLIEGLGAAGALGSVATVTSGAREARRVPKRLVILALDERGLLSEVDRVVLGARHVLLAAAELEERLDSALRTIARPGFRLIGAARGLPTSWRMFRDVEVVALSESKVLDLAALVPTGWSQMSLHDGFRLPGRSTWLAGSPPGLSVSVLAGGEVDIVGKLGLSADEDLDRETDDEGAQASEEQAPAATILRRSVSSVGQVDLTELCFEAGQYFFTAAQSSSAEVVARARATLKEALPSALEHGYGHDPDGPLWPVTAVPGGPLRGAALAELSPTDLTSDGLSGDSGLLVLAPAGEEEPDDIEEAVLPDGAQIDVPPCFVTGAHSFALGDNTSKGATGACKHCGMEKWFAPPVRKRSEAVKAVVVLPPLLERGASSDDDMLRAISAVGEGSRGALELLVDQVDDAPWALDERGRTLSALGHIDLRLDARGRICGWSVAAPVLAVDTHGDAVLTGWRSPQLTSTLERVASELDGRLDVTPNEDAPTRIALTGLERRDVEEVARVVSQELQVGLSVVDDAPLRLAAALPAARSLLLHLPVTRTGDALQWLRPGVWKWDDADHVGLPGAYRSRQLPRRHFVFDGRELRSCEGRLARWLAVPKGMSQLAYDPRTCTLTVPLGGRLPGLWERAAVLSSGRPPQKSGGRLLYRDVRPAVAAELAASLATETEGIRVV